MDTVNPRYSCRIESQCMKVVSDSGNLFGRVMLRWRKARLDLAALSSITQSLFTDAQRKT